MLILTWYEVLTKWVGITCLFAVLSLLTACADQDLFGTSFASRQPTQQETSEEKPTSVYKPSEKEASLPPLRIPKGMIGMSASDVKSLMGEPNLLRKDLDAQMWQYADQDCVLLLYLYLDVGAVYRVKHMEVRTKKNSSVNAGQCSSLT